MVGGSVFVAVRLGRPLVPDGHDEQDALHDGRQHVDAPGAPAAPAEARPQAGGEQETPGGLDAHHQDAEAAGVLQPVRRPYLRDVLDRGEHRRRDAQHVRPRSEVRWCSERESCRDHDHGEAVDQADAGDGDGGPPRGLVWIPLDILVVIYVFGILPSEKDEK